MKGITPYQLEILKTLQVVEKETLALCDFDQLLSRLSWAPSKPSAQFTVRAVIGKNLVQKSGIQTRRGRNRVCYALTENGKKVLDPRPKYVPESVPEKSLEDSLEMSVLTNLKDFEDIPGLSSLAEIDL